jgi:UDP-glucose:(heptosyl)LPS alpha-1,3-glucosyltransferase
VAAGAGPGLTGKAALALRVVVVLDGRIGRGRTACGRLPDAVAICHNDALAGEVYVNHGIVLAAMRARGARDPRMARNPLHLFTLARDTVRFGTRTHRVVVNLTVRRTTSCGDLPEGRARHRGHRQRRRHAATPSAQ